MEKVVLMGLKSGLSGARWSDVAPAAWTIPPTLGPSWLDRLPMTTMMPCANSGTRTASTEVSRAARSIRPAGTKGAATPDRRRLATKVVVLQWP